MVCTARAGAGGAADAEHDQGDPDGTRGPVHAAKRDQQKEESEVMTGLTDRSIDQDKVFTSQNGRYIHPSVFTGWFNEVLVEAGLPHYSIHSLRHTNIALQIAAGVPLVTVSARAGHARTSTTSDIYAYLLKSSDQEAADQLDNVFNASQSIVNSSTNDQITSLMKIQEEMKLHGCKTLEDYMQYLNNGIC